MTYGDAGRALGVPPNALRYAAPTGRILIDWDGARQPVIWAVPAPELDPWEARLELARRHLHVFGPATPTAFGDWAGIRPERARAAYEALAPELLPVRTPAGDAWVLAADEPALRAAPASAAARGSAAAPGSAAAVAAPSTARLLPSGDAYYLLQGADRDLLVPDPVRRSRLWTSRVWPGAILVGGEIVGTWRRSEGAVTLEPWRRLSAAERSAVEAEAASLPLPGLAGRITTAWAADDA
jgi:hypothetical protein